MIVLIQLMESIHFEIYTSIPQAEFKARVVLVRERMESKEQEITGQWLTAEKMANSGDYTETLV